MQTARWRFYLGTGFFLLPFPLFILLPLCVPFMGFDGATSSAMIGGGLAGIEVVWFLSIPLLGKQGFLALKKKTFARILVFFQSPGETRYYTGLFCLVLGLLSESFASLFALLLGNEVGDSSSAAFGMSFSEQNQFFMSMEYLSLGLFFLGAILVGSEFFSRLAGALHYPK
jgi:hypothetical protein